MHLLAGLTLVSFLVSCSILPLVTCRQVHQLVLYDLHHLDDWAGVQGFKDTLEASASRVQSLQVDPTPISSGLIRGSTAPSVPTQLVRRGTFTSNVCPISTQTTVFVSVDGSSTITLSSTVGPRPTGIPGDTGTSDGADSTGNADGTQNTGGESLSNKEGLITGLVIVVVILLASFCAFCSYFYKKRRNAQLQRLSLRQPGTTSADLVRQMGNKGLLSLSNSGPILRRPHLPSSSMFTGLVRRIKTRIMNKTPETRRDSQSSELLEWKRRVHNSRWSEVNPPSLEKSHAPPSNQVSPQLQVITSPPVSLLALPPVAKAAAATASSSSSTGANTFGAPRSSGGSGVSTEFVPIVQRRVSAHPTAVTAGAGAGWVNPARLSAVRPISLSSSSVDDRSQRRNSKGEPLSPSAWIAGFSSTTAAAANTATAAAAHAGATTHATDPFNNPSYVSSSGHDDRLSDPATSPMSSGYSFHHSREHQPLSMVAEVGEMSVRPDGASDIMSALGSAFGDRPTSRQSETSSTNEFEDERWTQVVHYHPLSDVEEVLTPVADERLSIQPGGLSLPWRSAHDSLGSLTPRRIDVSLSPTSPRFRRSVEIHPTPTASTSKTSPLSATPQQQQQFSNPFADSNDDHLINAAAMIPPAPRAPPRRPPGAYRRKSEATSLHNGILPSEKSGSISITGTSIVRPGSIDTSEWDDPAVRKQEEDLLFYRAPSSASVVR